MFRVAAIGYDGNPVVIARYEKRVRVVEGEPLTKMEIDERTELELPSLEEAVATAEHIQYGASIKRAYVLGAEGNQVWPEDGKVVHEFGMAEAGEAPNEEKAVATDNGTGADPED